MPMGDSVGRHWDLKMVVEEYRTNWGNSIYNAEDGDDESDGNSGDEGDEDSSSN